MINFIEKIISIVSETIGLNKKTENKKIENKKRPKIGLAFGSGGPKGLAHIGVIKVLEKNNIPIDFIAGSSIGSMIGGFYAATKDIKQIEKIALDADKKLIFSLIDFSFRQGLICGNKVKNYIEKYINKIHFQDLKIPLSIVATNLKNGNAVVMNEGEVALAVRASISSPLIFKPIKEKGKLLADGGLSVPVPVDIVKEMGADIVIAVNLDTDYFGDDNNKNTDFGFYKIANHSINLLCHHLALCNVKNADIVVTPQTGDLHWGKFLDGKDVILAGEKAMEDKLNELKKLF
ncbi:MAG: patatin-like phospholipase family protein [Candidatus Pacebacteria bacterium]|nr:patatin-like phospholipase family protein [Candidatus Paceibacterota bacterium]